MPVPVPAVIPGNAAGMRDLAQSLKTQAGRVGGVVDEIGTTERGMTFEGPAGNRFRSRMKSAAANLDQVATGLTDTAGMLERAADEVDASQRAHDVAVEANAREAQLEASNARHVSARL
jgi:uncharacterized protein YukE